jgi:hypothetical protein
MTAVTDYRYRGVTGFGGPVHFAHIASSHLLREPLVSG